MTPKTLTAIAIGVMQITQLAAGGQDAARAVVRWQQRPSLAAAFHLATSGVFLAEDVAALS